MPLKIENINLLRKYFSAVVDRADHHAPNVDEIIYTLLGIVILRAEDVWVRGNEGSTGNILWATVNGIKYAFRYEHSDGTIELRRDTYNGPIILKIDNSTSVSTILSAF